MYSDISFDIAMNGIPYPVRFDPTVLDEFLRDHVCKLDTEIVEVSDSWFGPSMASESDNLLGVVAQLIRDAMQNENGVQVAKYVLWMAARHPEISGLKIDNDCYEFTASPTSAPEWNGASLH